MEISALGRKMDPQLKAHHIRLTKIPDNFNILVSTSPVVVCQHTWSEKRNQSATLHYHIYWEHEKPITRKTFAKRLKEMFNVHGQKDFMVSDPRDLASFWQYAMSSYNYAKKGASLVMWNIQVEQLPFYPELPVIIDPDLNNSITHTVVKAKVKSKSWKQQFYEHCIDKYLEAYGDTEVSKGVVMEWFIKWSCYGFNDPQMIACVRYVYWEFNPKLHDQIIEEYSMKWIEKI